MNFKANFEGVNITSASPYSYTIVSPPTASTVHQIFCLVAGSIIVAPLGGGQFTWVATAGQSMDVMVGAATAITTASFVGFRSKFFPSQGSPFYNS